MNKNKVSTILNSSNQANLLGTNDSALIQTNILAIIGKVDLSNNYSDSSIPLFIRVNESGEIEIQNFNNLKDDIQIYTDKKVSMSEKGGN